MASRTVKLRIETELQKKALDDAVKGIRKVDQAIEKSGKTSVQMSKQGTKSAKANSWAMGQAAMQLQDVSVQAQMGTDSMRILGQQGPQLLSAFGPTGMLAGLAVAVGAGLVSAFRQPKKELSELLEEMDEFGSRVKAMGDVRFQSMEDSLQSMISRAQDAAAAFEKLSATRTESDNRAISAKDALIRAQIEWNKLQGFDQKLEEQKLAAAQAQRKILEEQNALNTALAKKRHEEIQQLETLNKKHDILNAQIETKGFLIQEKEAQRKVAFDAYAAALGEEGKRWFALGAGGSEGPEFLQMSASKGQAKETKAAYTAIQSLNDELVGLRGGLEGMAVQSQDLSLSIMGAERQVEETKATMDANLEKIDLEGKAKALGTSMANMGDQLATVAAEVNEAADALGGKGPEGIMARLRLLLEDGIQTQELDEITRLLKQMGVNVGKAYGKQNKTLSGVIGELTRLSNQADQNERSLQTLQQRSKTPGN